jgi:hypothetical protein
LAEREKKKLKKALEGGIFFLGRQCGRRQVKRQRQIGMRIRDMKRF